MKIYAVITENDESKWDDETGVKYHFPSRYRKFLPAGAKVVYYKGRLKNKKYHFLRLSASPHYFGVGEIKKLLKKKNTTSYFAFIDNFSKFKEAIPFKQNNITLEAIPRNRITNYWRDGVRPISENTYLKILSLANFAMIDDMQNDQSKEEFTSTVFEGGKRKKYTTVYERNKALREQAIKIHGHVCKVCDFNFKKKYGVWGEGYIHVHHKKPISSFKEKVEVNPETDLEVLCANCHSMIHRKKDKILTSEELKSLMTRKVR